MKIIILNCDELVEHIAELVANLPDAEREKYNQKRELLFFEKYLKGFTDALLNKKPTKN